MSRIEHEAALTVFLSPFAVSDPGSFLVDIQQTTDKRQALRPRRVARLWPGVVEECDGHNERYGAREREGNIFRVHFYMLRRLALLDPRPSREEMRSPPMIVDQSSNHYWGCRADSID